MLLVEVVMSTRNRQDRLEGAIDSVLSQTFQSWKLIIIDDCSSDNTWEVLSKYRSHPKISLYRNSKNLGCFPSRAPAMLSSPAKYLAMLDDDDRWFPTYLEKMVEGLEKNPDKNICYCDAWKVYPNGEVRYMDTSKAKPFPNVLPSCTLLRASTFKALGGWDEAFKHYHTEADYYYRAGGKAKSIHIPKPLVRISVTPHSLSASKLLDLLGLLNLMEKHRDILTKEDLSWFYTRIGIHSCEIGAPSSEHFIRAIKEDPRRIEAWGGLILSSINRDLFLGFVRGFRRIIRLG